jgi:ribosomal protein L11 methylase PrmA
MIRTWPALILQAKAVDDTEDIVSAVLVDFSPVAIQDLAARPLPPGGLWDPTYPPIPDPPPTPLHWNVCFSDAEERDRAGDAIRASLPNLSVEPVDLPDEDWAKRSQDSLKAVRAGAFIIAPPWDLPPEDVDATVIVIEPSMGFGTGHHATTRMCLRLLSEIDGSDATVLDLGTGSGVLSMAAALMGARSVVGIDVDQDAINSAETSAQLNTLPDTITFQVLDFRHDPPKPADIVGFDHTEVDRVLAAFASFTERQRLSEDNWIALQLQSLRSV